MSSRLKSVLFPASLLLAILVFFLAFKYFLGLIFWGASFQNYGAQFVSPTYSTNKVVFIDDGYLKLYAKSGNQKPKFVSRLEWEHSFHFTIGRWTQDGEVFVCLLEYDGAIKDNTFVAYDFSIGKSMVPSWVGIYTDNMMPEGKAFELKIKKLIDSHGGLVNRGIDYNKVKKNEKLRFWNEASDSGSIH